MIITAKQAAKMLLDGEAIAIPTETVYGLAASIASESAIHKIFSLKGRPLNNPLIVHVSAKSDLDVFVSNYPPFFEEIIGTFWPGPLTIILPATNIPSLVSAGLPTVAFRIPCHPIAKEILSEAGPLVIPSANLSGKPSATSAAHVERDFGTEFPVVDGGICEKGLESTILIYKDEMWQIARLGAIEAEQFHNVLPYIPILARQQGQGSPICPGQLYRHYAPNARLILTNEFKDASLILGFSDRSYPSDAEVWHLGYSNNPSAVAKELYSLLRKLDEKAKTIAWVDFDFPNDGLWETIRERLSKAALKN